MPPFEDNNPKLAPIVVNDGKDVGIGVQFSVRGKGVDEAAPIINSEIARRVGIIRNWLDGKIGDGYNRVDQVESLLNEKGDKFSDIGSQKLTSEAIKRVKDSRLFSPEKTPELTRLSNFHEQVINSKAGVLKTGAYDKQEFANRVNYSTPTDPTKYLVDTKTTNVADKPVEAESIKVTAADIPNSNWSLNGTRLTHHNKAKDAEMEAASKRDVFEKEVSARAGYIENFLDNKIDSSYVGSSAEFKEKILDLRGDRAGFTNEDLTKAAIDRVKQQREHPDLDKLEKLNNAALAARKVELVDTKTQAFVPDAGSKGVVVYGQSHFEETKVPVEDVAKALVENSASVKHAKALLEGHGAKIVNKEELEVVRKAELTRVTDLLLAGDNGDKKINPEEAKRFNEIEKDKAAYDKREPSLIQDPKLIAKDNPLDKFINDGMIR